MDEVMKSLRSMKFLFKDKLTSMASTLLILFIFLAIFGPLVAPYPKEGRGKANVDNSFYRFFVIRNLRIIYQLCIFFNYKLVGNE